MDSEEYQHGYWKGMPARLRPCFVGWLIYWLIAIWMTSVHLYFGIALLVLPVAFWIAKVWLFEESLQGVGAGSNGLIVYSVHYLWKTSIYVRAFMMVTVVVAALGALGWLGTEQMRQEAARPSLSERVSETASGLVVATSDKVGDAASATKGWVDRAKGWFVSEEPASE